MTDACTNWFVINLVKKSTWSLLCDDCHLKHFARGSHIWSELNSTCIFDVALCLRSCAHRVTVYVLHTNILPRISFQPLSKRLSANVNFFRCVVMIVLSSCHFVLWVNYVTYSERGWHSHLSCVVCVAGSLAGSMTDALPSESSTGSSQPSPTRSPGMFSLEVRRSHAGTQFCLTVTRKLFLPK